MGRINILDSSIYNLISAGEVVERPASVVKELVENALDAGAKNIKIEITAGGKSKIKVTDDGAGMTEDDLKRAFLPHATSKITTKDDLFDIRTLGFRGEALASIAAVAMVSAISKTDDEDAASSIELRGGDVISRGQTAGVRGTTITVENLFFATPARLKFLKRDKSEESDISSLVASLILANPSVAFIYTADGRTVYQSYGNGLNNAILSVYNREITMNFTEIENTFDEFSLSGYISAPTFFKGNRSYQTTVLNGRVIENKIISTAVEKAYEPFLMKRSYPLYILNIQMPVDFFDVNVHPGKLDVRFSDNHKVFSFIYHSVQRVLMAYDDIKGVPQLEYIDDSAEKNSSAEKQGEREGFKSFAAVSGEEKADETNNKSVFSGFSDIFKHTGSARNDSGEFYRAIKNRIAVTDSEASADKFDKDAYVQESIDFIPSKPKGSEFLFEGKIIGQAFETYILVEKGDNLYVIDQHAAHERILYDRLMSRESVFSQPLLIPYIYTANAAEYDFITDCIPNLMELGFDISELSGFSFKISAVPEPLTNINFNKFFAYLTRDLIKMNVKTKDILKEKLMQTACKSAIKGGDSFSVAQIEVILSEFAGADNKPLQCPHGRPAVIKLSKSDFEKWFKRVL